MKIITKVILLPLLFIPFYVVRIKLFLFPTTLLEVFVILAIVAFILEYGFSSLISSYLSYPFIIRASIFTFLILGLLSLFFSSDFRSGIGVYKAFVVEPIFYGMIINFLLQRGILNINKII